MSRRQRPEDQARSILLDANVLAALVDDALANLDLGLAGWPESTPGASPLEARPSRDCHHKDCSNESPCAIHEPDANVSLTPTERLASRPDTAARDLDAMLEAIHKAAGHMAKAAVIANRWAHVGVTKSAVKAKLVSIDAGIWCANCSTFGRHEPREAERTECNVCRTFRLRYNRPMPPELWDARDARNGRLDETTIARILKQLDATRDAKKEADKIRQRTQASASSVPDP